ncbi:cytochrome C [Tamlana haliotis]|uniref:Cytochrome C n=1 Tax=Pseudotamlana haliotis TaxID=2614804 RepID=A0A6N6MEZ6_9FLAO|nr:heme-binding domain-containing protein [Tamlana haliotis]KAB1069368.1 cytochrome C [Tamlana haliotis]
MKKVFLVLLVLFVIAQFFGPERNEGNLQSVEPFVAETNPPEDVKRILEETCYDCHSDVTRYPWYDKITPVNYWLASHVNDGKKHLNFSNWIDNSVKRKDHKFDELIEMIEEKEMPLNSYTWTHTEANLSDEQIQSVIEWAKIVRAGYALQLPVE